MKTGRVRSVMSCRVETASMDEDLEVALQRMLWSGIRHLPVLRSNGELGGVLSHRDVLERMSLVTDALSLGHTSARELVGHAMRVPAQTIGPEETVGAAARKMADRKLGCLPVVEGGRIVGIVTTTDLLAELGMSEALREITASPDVASVMTRDPESAQAGDSLSEAIAKMSMKGIRHLPVVDEELRVIGILSDRDIRSAFGHPRHHLADPRAAKLVVGQIMAPAPFLLHPDEPILRAVGRFLDERVGALPVVDPDGRLVGIVSYLDVLRFLRGARVWGEAEKSAD